MKVNLTMLDKYRLGATAPILLFRQNKTAEQVLNIAKRAVKGGRISTDKAEITSAIAGWNHNLTYQRQLLESVEVGQIVGVILAN